MESNTVRRIHVPLMPSGPFDVPWEPWLLFSLPSHTADFSILSGMKKNWGSLVAFPHSWETWAITHSHVLLWEEITAQDFSEHRAVAPLGRVSEKVPLTLFNASNLRFYLVTIGVLQLLHWTFGLPQRHCRS